MEDKKNLITNILLTALYGIITLIVVLHHEIWADEAQVWMIVKNISLSGLFHHLVNEGHPSFFYLLLMPFAKILHGPNAILSMQLICWAAMCVAVGLLLQFSPFDRFTKFAIITSSGFLYFFPVIARSYSILPLLVFLTAILYPKAKERPFLYTILLVLMANTHIIMFAFAGLLAMFFIYDNIIKNFKALENLDKKKLLTSAAIAVFGLLAVWIQLKGTTSSNVFIKFDFTQIIKNTFDVMTKFFLNPIENQTEVFIKMMYPLIEVPAFFVSVILYLIFFITLLLNNKRMFVLASLSIIFQIAIYVLGYHYWVFTTRIFCAHIILLFCFWVMLSDKNIEYKNTFNKKFINVTLSIFFILTLFNGLRYSILDLNYNYSGAKETAEFIKTNIDKENSLIITDNEPYSVTIAYYLDGSGYGIYSAMHKKNITYITWDKLLYNMLSEEGWDDYIKYMQNEDKNFKTKKIYAVFPMFNKYSLNVDDLKNFKMIFQSKPTILKYEGFRIYEYEG